MGGVRVESIYIMLSSHELKEVDTASHVRHLKEGCVQDVFLLLGDVEYVCLARARAADVEWQLMTYAWAITGEHAGACLGVSALRSAAAAGTRGIQEWLKISLQTSVQKLTQL